jgi:hypothetical protein
VKRAPVLTAGIVTLLLLLYMGCGSDSPPNAPPPDGKTIVTLSDGERGFFCMDLAAIEGGYSNPHELTCNGVTNTVTFSIGTGLESCKQVFMALPATCASLTVGQFRTCVTDTYAETCDNIGTSPPSCQPVLSCLIGAP